MPYVSLTAYYSPSFILNHGSPTCCYTLISFSRSILFSSINEAHPLAVKLIKLIKDGEIPESCIYYKFHNDTTSFTLVDSKIASGFKWDDEVCEFFSTIKYLGGERTRKFVRGSGFLGTGRGGEKNSNHSRILTCVEPP